MLRLVATVALALPLAACAGAPAEEVGDAQVFVPDAAPDDGTPTGRSACDLVVAGIEAFNRGELVETVARFEEAVAKLGVDRAKPQAISQLMGVEGDNAPTRQNIKSHLQKYRLLLKKRAAQAANDLSSGSGAGSPTMKMRSATKCAPA